MELSIILGGRDDNYGENFIERFHQAVSTNLDLLDKSNLDYEMIVVDFNPVNGKYLHINPLMEDLLSHKRVKNLIVDQSVLTAEDLTPTTYYEYFAKNVGCRISLGEMIFITNSDIILTEKLIDTIKLELVNENKNDYFYRTRYRGDIEVGQKPSDNPKIIQAGEYLTGHLNGWGNPNEVLNLHNKKDDKICGLWSGDASMFSRHVFFDVATGYNEKDYGHRTSSNQSNMDSEILENLYVKGKRLKLLEAPYFHLYHGHPISRDNVYSKSTYTNNDEWGFVNYNKERINNNTEIIFDGDLIWD